MEALSASELAELAGATQAEIHRMVDLGILVARDGPGPFLPADVRKVSLAKACEKAGLPMDGIGAAIGAGRLSFAFLEAAPYQRWALRSARTYRQVSEEAGSHRRCSRGRWSRWGSPRCRRTTRSGRTSWRWSPLLRLSCSTGILDQA